jgi:hypothetical protein
MHYLLEVDPWTLQRHTTYSYNPAILREGVMYDDLGRNGRNTSINTGTGLGPNPRYDGRRKKRRPMKRRKREGRGGRGRGVGKRGRRGGRGGEGRGRGGSGRGKK